MRAFGNWALKYVIQTEVIKISKVLLSVQNKFKKTKI